MTRLMISSTTFVLEYFSCDSKATALLSSLPTSSLLFVISVLIYDEDLLNGMGDIVGVDIDDLVGVLGTAVLEEDEDATETSSSNKITLLPDTKHN